MKTIRVKPILVESNTKTNLLINSINNRLLFNCEDVIVINAKYQQLILISLEDEKIKVGDKFINDYGEIVTATKQILDQLYFLKKKVIATQEQLSPELIQQLVDEYNNGGMKNFEIEMVEITEPVQDGHWNKYTQLLPKITNGFVTVVEKKPDNFISFLKERIDKASSTETKVAYTIVLEQYKKEILYTEEEVLKLLDKLLNIDCSFTKEDGSQCIVQKGLPYTLQEWFNKNKKK